MIFPFPLFLASPCLLFAPFCIFSLFVSFVSDGCLLLGFRVYRLFFELFLRLSAAYVMLAEPGCCFDVFSSLSTSFPLDWWPTIFFTGFFLLDLCFFCSVDCLLPVRSCCFFVPPAVLRYQFVDILVVCAYFVRFCSVF